MLDFIEDAVVENIADAIRTELHECQGKDIEITLAREDAAFLLARRLGRRVKPANTRLYTATKLPLPSCSPARQMFEEDEPLLDSLRQRVWPAYREKLRSGLKFYGYVVDGGLKAMCGLCQMTAYRSEIIRIETFEPADRRKGYATAVCIRALYEGFRQTPYVPHM